MNKLWRSALLSLAFTLIWLVLMIISTGSSGAVTTQKQAIDLVSDIGVLFRMTYLNAVFITITVTVFYVCLYYYCKQFDKIWSLAGLVFVPIYSLLNLLVYFSQIAIVPKLVGLWNTSVQRDVYEVILAQFVQVWSGSIISVLNQLAYAVLGIPSIIFGILIVKHKKIPYFAAWLLILNGSMCILGAIGTVLNNQNLAAGSAVGGVLFLLALIFMVVRLHPSSIESNDLTG